MALTQDHSVWLPSMSIFNAICLVLCFPSHHIFLCPFPSGFISNLTIQRQYFPTDEDQTGAAKALLRLQDTYRLDTNTISTGDLPGKRI